MKGAIKPDHVAVNNYILLVLGLPPLTFTKVSGIDDKLETTELPDRTRASGGNRKAVEFTTELPLHHNVEEATMEVWFRESQDPVLPSYKKTAVLIHKSISGLVLKTFNLVGLFPTGRKLPDLDMKDEGTMAVVTWSFSADDIIPLS